MRRSVSALVLLCVLSLGAARAGYVPPDLSLSVRGPRAARVGERIAYVATVRNSGPGAIVRAGVGFELDGVRVGGERTRASSGSCRRVPGGGADVACERFLPDLPAGGSLRFALSLRLLTPGTLRVYVSDFSNTVQSSRLNDTAVLLTRVQPSLKA